MLPGEMALGAVCVVPKTLTSATVAPSFEKNYNAASSKFQIFLTISATKREPVLMTIQPWTL